MCRLQTDTVNECNSSTAGADLPEVTLLCGYTATKSCNNKMRKFRRLFKGAEQLEFEPFRGYKYRAKYIYNTNTEAMVCKSECPRFLENTY